MNQGAAAKHVLLLGAGFSRNWGGWLASEAFEYLLGRPEIDDPLRQLLWKHRRGEGFEGALGEVQEQFLRSGDPISREQLRRLEAAIGQMFADMNRGFANRNFEFQTDTAYLVRTFLVLFDAIFTLNQDLLLERHYLNDNVMLGNHPRGRWNGWQIVGMQRRHAQDAGFVVPGEVNLGVWVPAPKAIIEPRYQPYIKLHGSSNWRDAMDARIWVMGTNKRATLTHYSFLTQLHDLFRQSLTTGPARLMIIGYSFNDEHINEIVLSAADRGQLEVFIVDPLGIGVLDKNASHPIYSEHDLLQRLKPHVVGASRRPLGEIFGADQVEHRKVMGFFPETWLPRDRPWPWISEG
jgi:hypothetical protein